MKPDPFYLLLENYQRYHNNAIVVNRFTGEHLLPILKELEEEKTFTLEAVGLSFEGRSIFRVEWGKGPQHILLWSQMHGDESTATRAILDVLNFLRHDDEFNELRANLQQKLTLHFIPMLNPDGAARWTRRTLQGIDMNRDAIRLQTPEARILKSIRDQYQPLFGFNLHDQNVYYGAGMDIFPATISFLAPAYNEQKEMNYVRGRAIKLIAHLSLLLEEVIPGQIGRYDDTFNPIAFGDNFQKQGTSVILIESGGYRDDPEKEYIRKLNFALMVESLSSIAEGTFEQADASLYDEIPFNQEDRFFDLIIRNADCERNGKSYKMDIGIRREQVSTQKSGKYYARGIIADLGDLSQFHGFEEIDANGLKVEYGRTYDGRKMGYEDIKTMDLERILLEGFTSIINVIHDSNEAYIDHPINVMGTENSLTNLEVGQVANLVFLKNGSVEEIVVNGFRFDKKQPNFGIRNGLLDSASGQ